ncbi:hypothetical protein C8J56DRAFT_36697 [Mycena floridula]|nr:hypothetical protein C8J56DRAFT_36697 [Mycena floridula]
MHFSSALTILAALASLSMVSATRERKPIGSKDSAYVKQLYVAPTVTPSRPYVAAQPVPAPVPVAPAPRPHPGLRSGNYLNRNP